MQSDAVESKRSASSGRILLVGSPNVGKSVFFGLLTGKYVVVSNYPGTTVEIAEGHGTIQGRDVVIVDTPGANSLSPNSEDEKVARDVVLAAGAKTVVQVGDAKNLRRALFITAQLAEYEIPSVLVLNMWDEAQDRGMDIDFAAVRDAVGVPVTATVATERRGFNRVVSSVADACVPAFRPNYGEALESAIGEVVDLLDGVVERGARGHALALLAGDRSMTRALAAAAPNGFAARLGDIRNRAAQRFSDPLGLVIQRKRAAHADDLVDEAVTKADRRGARSGFWRNAFFYALGPALFYAVGWRLTSLLLFGGDGEARVDLLGPAGSHLVSHAAGFVSLALYMASAWRREYASGQSATLALARLSTHPVGGLPVLVFVLWALYVVVGVLGAGAGVDLLEGRLFGVYDEATGEYGGVINNLLSRGLAAAVGGGGLVYGFFFDETAGLMSIGVTYAVAIVFPIVTLFFLAFSLMEDSGYLPRLALLADRAFKRVGLSGKAVLPMVLGLGCGTMATMTARILETRKQRLIAILLLSLVVPCSAQLGIITAALAGISANGTVIYLVTIGVVIAVVGWAANRLLPGAQADFLIEVPPFRMPGIRNVVVKTYYRVKWFMREAVPLFIAGTAFLFVGERTGLLRAIEYVARPLVKGLLGLPIEATHGFIMGFLRRDYGAVKIFELFRSGAMEADQALVALVVITLFIPCLAHLLVCVKELGMRKAMLMSAFVLSVAFAVGGLLRLALAVTGLQVVAVS